MGYKLACAVAALGILAGCGGQPIGTLERASFHRQQAADALHGLAFMPGTAELAPGEAERLGGFLAGLALAGTPEVLVNYVPSGSFELDRARVAAASAVTASVAPEMRLNVVLSREFGRADRRSDIMVFEALSRGQLLVSCPNAALSLDTAPDETPVPPLGCANAANLAHMAARPADLVEPRPLGPTSGIVEGAAIIRLRAGEVIAPPPVTTVTR